MVFNISLFQYFATTLSFWAGLLKDLPCKRAGHGSRNQTIEQVCANEEKAQNNQDAKDRGHGQEIPGRVTVGHRKDSRFPRPFLIFQFFGNGEKLKTGPRRTF